MLNHDDLLPEEQAHPEFHSELQKHYRMSSEETQLLQRTRERLAKMPVSLAISSAKIQRNAPKHVQKPLNVATRPWLRPLSTLVAVLIVAIIIGAFLFTFSLIRNSGVAKNNPSQIAASHEPAPRFVELMEGNRLHMVSEQEGWSIGIGAQESWGSVLRTTDGGKSWKPVTPSGIHSIFDLYILDSKTAWLPVWDLTKSPLPVWLYRTIDGGKTWERFSYSGADIISLTFADKDHGWAIKTQQSNQDTSKTKITDIAKQKSTLRKNTLIRTNDGGKTWQNVTSLPAGLGGIGSLYFIDEQTGWTTGVDKPGIDAAISLYITHNGGKTWQKQSLPSTPAPLGLAHQPVFFDKNTGYFIARTNEHPSVHWYAYITHDGGKTWQRSRTATPDYVRQLIDDQHALGNTLQDTNMKDIILLNITNNQTVSTSPNGNGLLIDYSFLSIRTGFALKQVSNSIIDLYKTDDGGKTWHKVAALPKTA
ncbi:WD40/YVTN/BNR-like repeat-containing protein [Ktedonospora formicarum]|uniref:Sortilin N-terminal domain-containing protein n=1 Tax=Ktedonospora formicarum TaxID=2778364 RepID=A0A8J3MTZ0_9CHLR|nr:exo-alpha-sialidase [Ktedonospora formicarum]GHO46093.1 hypothetical protein KSX_42560 [Ktedonospora formicarum]